MQLLPLKTFLILSSLRSTLFLASSTGKEVVLSLLLAPLVVAGSRSLLCRCGTTARRVLSAAVVVLSKGNCFWASVLIHLWFSLHVVTGSGS